MQTLNFKSRQEYENWASQNKGLNHSLNGQTMGQPSLPAPAQRQDRGFLGNLVSSVVDPFTGLMTKSLEAGRAIKHNRLNDFLTGSNDYQAKVMSDEDYNKFKENALLDTGKDLAGVASWLIPGGAAAKGIGSLVKGGLVGGALGGFSASDKSDFSGLLNDAGTGALTGGAMAGGLGLGGKLLGNLGKSKIGQGLQDAGQSVKSSNLGYKPLNLADGTAGKVTQQLGEAGLPVTGANAQKLADSNSKAFRTTLTDSGKIIDFGGQKQNFLGDLANLESELMPTIGSGKTKLNAGQIKNRLKMNPDTADMAEALDDMEGLLGDMNTGSLGEKIGKVRSTLNRNADASKIVGIDNLAIELDAKMPGYGIADATDPADAIERFMLGREKLKGEIQSTYKSLHEGLLNSDDVYAKQFGQKVPEIPSINKTTSGASQSLQDDITNVLEKDFGLGKNEIAGSKQIQNALKDKIDSILRTEGDPNKIMDEIGRLTVDKNLVGDITLANKNKVIEATRQVLKDKLQNAIPEAQGYFQKNQPLRAVAKDATKMAQNLDKVPVPFLNTQLNIPGVGNLKQGITNLFGGGLDNAGKLTDGLAGLLSGAGGKGGKLGQFMTIPNIARGVNAGTGFGAIDTAQDQGMQDFDPMASEIDTMQMPQAPESEYSQDEIRQAMMELTAPVKQGGRGFSPSEAQKFLQLAYGIGGNSQSSTSAGAKSTKITDASKKFFAASDLAQKALRSLESGKVGTGKLATVGNKFGEFFGSQSAEQTDYLSNVASARGSAISALSGANVPPSEYDRIADLIPTSMDEPQIAKQKLKSFIEAMKTYANPNTN